MLVSAYNEFVKKTDQYKDKTPAERRAIALYGIVGEIGSLVSAVKKKLLAEDGEHHWNKANDEIVGELGDVIWYCFSLAQIENVGRQVNILTNDIALLKRELSGKNERAQKVHAALDVSRKDAFLAAAKDLPRTPELRFADYQELAFLTARTNGRVLLEVCLAVLWQLAAELLRLTLPAIELTLNKRVADRRVNVVLGEIAWHLAAIASVYGISLDAVVEANERKVSFRAERSDPTPLHDLQDDPSEQLPRQMAVSFISVSPEHTRMYVGGKMLGNTLDDNSYVDDGYRFHDVMHLACIAYLGWSPVQRGFLRRKRKSRKDKTDAVEDGARAKLVEEVVLKAIHSEGVRLSKESGRPPAAGEVVRLFPTRSAITFRLLKAVQEHVDGLEVSKNKFWEWEDAIYNGADIFHQLRCEQQGTVTLDMEKRTLTFSPTVCIDLKGVVVGVGSAIVTPKELAEERNSALTSTELVNEREVAHYVAAKRAILGALGIDRVEDHYGSIVLNLLGAGRVSVKASGVVREQAWRLGAIAYQMTFTPMNDGLYCTAVALADPSAK